MKKLELKHLTGYLPYGLKGITQRRIVKIQGFELGVELTLIWGAVNSGFTGRCDFGFKPILLPLSYLTKEIEVNGEKFVPIDIIKQDFFWDYVSNNMRDLIKGNDYTLVDYLPKIVTDKLFEWHFDIYGLIESGLAIDINKI